MEAEGLRARRLPQQVILADARARPPRQRRAQAAHLLFQHDPSDGPVGLPAVADLPRPIRRVPRLAPVPFVRIQAGLELAAEQRLESRSCERNLLGAQEAIEDQEPVRVKLLDLSRGELHHLDSTSPRTRCRSAWPNTVTFALAGRFARPCRMAVHMT